MSKSIAYGGTVYVVPDDATDDEITAIVDHQQSFSIPSVGLQGNETIQARPFNPPPAGTISAPPTAGQMARTVLGNVVRGTTPVLKSAWDVSTPGMLVSKAINKYPELANVIPQSLQGVPFKQLPETLMTTALPMIAGADVPAAAEGDTAAALARPAARVATAAPAEAPGIAGKLLREVPVVGSAVRKWDVLSALLKRAGVTSAEETPATVPDTPWTRPQTGGVPWGTAGGGPVDLRGQMIPQGSTIPVATAADATIPTVNTSPATVEQQLNDALGGRPLQRNIPLRQQTNVPMGQQQTSSLPVGFTPVNSSVLKGYNYNPATQEFESITTGGQHYVHGEVTPEQMQAFEAADSKGKAWNTLRQNATPVAKVINGQRVAVRPSSSLGSAAPTDLSPQAIADIARQSGAQPFILGSGQSAAIAPDTASADALSTALKGRNVPFTTRAVGGGKWRFEFRSKVAAGQ